MDISVHPAEKIVIVNGKARNVEANYPQGVSSMQWNGDRASGEIYYTDSARAPATVKDQEVFRPWYELFLAAQRLEKQRQEQEESRRKIEMEEAEKKLPAFTRLLQDPAAPSRDEILVALVLSAAKKPAQLNKLLKILSDLAAKYEVEKV